MTIIEERDQLLTAVAAASDLIDRSTGDSAKARPPAGRVHAVLGPPDITWPSWHMRETVWTLWLIAGTTSSQADALDLLYAAMDDLADSQTINLIEATPAGWDGGDRQLAAYKLSINKES